MTMRSPQKFNTQPGEPAAWRCEIRGRQVTIFVPNEDEVDYLIRASADQQQKLLEKIFARQQWQIQQGQQQQQPAASSSSSNTASNATPNATANTASRTPLTKQHLQIRCLSQQ